MNTHGLKYRHQTIFVLRTNRTKIVLESSWKYPLSTLLSCGNDVEKLGSWMVIATRHWTSTGMPQTLLCIAHPLVFRYHKTISDKNHAAPRQYFGLMNGIGVSVALRILLRTSTSTSVPFLCQPFSTYPIAMLVPTDGEGMPDVTAPGERKVGLVRGGKWDRKTSYLTAPLWTDRKSWRPLEKKKKEKTNSVA